MRFRIFPSLQSRDGTLQRGGRIVNGYTEAINKKTFVQKRPALALVDASLSGVGGGLWTDSRGTLGTVGINGTGTAATFFQLSASGSLSYTSISADTAIIFIGI